MRLMTLVPVLLLAGATASLAETAPDAATIARIDAALAAMHCEVDPDNIEPEADGGFDLDDVICHDGQYDLRLGPALDVVEKRKE